MSKRQAREFWIYTRENAQKIETEFVCDFHQRGFIPMPEDIHVIEATPEVRAAGEAFAIVRKVNELLKCKEGMLRAEGKCNDLICELLMLVPAELLARIAAEEERGE